MTYRLSLSVPELPHLNISADRHWRKRKQERDDWWYRLKPRLMAHSAGCPDAPLRLARVILTRHSTRQPDYDNLVSSFKSILDLLQPPKGKRPGLSIIADDKPGNFVGGHPEYRWEQAKRGEGHVTIEIEEVRE